MHQAKDQTKNLPIWRVKFFDDLTRSVQLEGKRVLEIGYGDGEIAKLVARVANPKFVYAIDPCPYNIYPIYEEENLMCLTMSANSLLFPNSYFDVIFSHNVFEHILDLPHAWEEIKRVLKPGGIFYTHFAPLWTHAYGHHYYNETDDEFFCMLPPYAHLYMSEDEMDKLIKAKTNLSQEREMAKNFIFGDVCNKLFPSDYRKILKENHDFEIQDYLEIKEHHHNRSIPEQVIEKYPLVPKEDFEISGITVKGIKLCETKPETESLREIYRIYAYSNYKPQSFLRRGLRKIKRILKF